MSCNKNGKVHNPTHIAQISGAGITEGDQLMNQFARKADLTVEQALEVMYNPSTHNVKESKADEFNEAVCRKYGDMDTFKIVYETTVEAEAEATAKLKGRPAQVARSF